MNTINTFLRDALQELHLVRWPTRHQAIRLSIITLVFIFVTSLSFGGIDYVLSKIISLLLSLT